MPTNINLWQFAVYALGFMAIWAGERIGRRGQLGWGLTWLVFSIPAWTYALYYTHVWSEPIWLYRVRALPGSELCAAPAGLLVGWLWRCLPMQRHWSRLLPGTALLLLLAVPYVKQYMPVRPPLESLPNRWVDGVCIQNTTATCGPASCATLLHELGIETTEAALAKAAFTSVSGTENWYLKRAVESYGVHCRYERELTPVRRLPYPAMAGVSLGPNQGHFVCVLGETDTEYLLADPASGRKRVPKDFRLSPYEFTGFFMVLEKAGR